MKNSCQSYKKGTQKVLAEQTAEQKHQHQDGPESIILNR